MSKTTRHFVFASVAVTAMLWATGCKAPIAPTTPTAMRVSVDSPEDFDTLWQATGKTLRKYYLEPDRQDRTEGVITTIPETTGVWFEPWRPQPQPAYAWWEANLHTIRRQATVTIRPVAEPEYELVVEVNRFKYSLAERTVDNPAGALRLYSEAAPTTSGRMEKPSRTARWIPLGRDGWMEQAILTDILKRYPGKALVPPHEPRP